MMLLTMESLRQAGAAIVFGSAALAIIKLRTLIKK